MSRDKQTPAAAQAVLDFWFGLPGSAEWGASRREWFAKSDAFDASIRERFLPYWQARTMAPRTTGP